METIRASLQNKMTYTSSIMLFANKKAAFSMLFWAVIALLFLWFGFASTRIFMFTKKAEVLIEQIEPYRQVGSGKPSILFLGDSMAYGTGSSLSETTIAGLIGQKLPEATISNKAKNGTKTRILSRDIKADIDKRYDIIIGANDVMHPEVSLKESKEHLDKIYRIASDNAENVIAITTGDFKHTSFFLYPLDLYFGSRSETLRNYAQEVSSRYKNVYYIDAFSGTNKPEWPSALESEDHLHLSDIGARYWVKKIFHNTNDLKF